MKVEIGFLKKNILVKKTRKGSSAGLTVPLQMLFGELSPKPELSPAQHRDLGLEHSDSEIVKNATSEMQCTFRLIYLGKKIVFSSQELLLSNLC